MFSYNRKSSSRFSDSASPRRFSFGRRLSNTSTFSVGTVNTILPEYSVVDPNDLQGQSAHPATSSTSTFQTPSAVDLDAITILDLDQPNAPSGSFTANLESAPRYSLLKSTTLEWRPDSSVIEDLTTLTEPHEYHYSYPIKSNDAWATLNLYTCDTVPGNPYPSQMQPKVPRVWGCNPIAGTIDLNLMSLQTIHQIKISLKGKLLTSSLNGGAFQFMHHESIVWQKAFGNPQHFNTLESSSNEKFDGKFIGKHSFPFFFPFPSHIDAQKQPAILPASNSISPFSAFAAMPGSKSTLLRPQDYGASSSASTSKSNEDVGTFPSDTKRPSAPSQRTDDRLHIGSVASHVPQTFAERDIPVTVVYELSAIITHGRFKTDSRIKTNISYTPATYPLAASQMRRDAYKSSHRLLGPMEDPTGWFALPKARSFGIFSGDSRQRQVAIDCNLYIAEPLSYPRGAVIPCFLELESDDMEALRSVGVPKVPVIRLLRRLRHFNSDAYALDHEELGQMTNTMATSFYSILLNPAVTGTVGKDLSVMAHEVGKASWRVPPNAQQASVKLLQGEIHLSDDLMASCSCDIFHVEYFVEMMALQSRYFEAILSPPAQGRPGRRSIASVPVEITTLHRVDEPVPVAFTKPSKPYKKRIRIEDTILEDKEAEGKQ